MAGLLCTITSLFLYSLLFTACDCESGKKGICSLKEEFNEGCRYEWPRLCFFPLLLSFHFPGSLMYGFLRFSSPFCLH